MNRYRKSILVLILLCVTFLAMSPVLFAGFTNWDDQRMLLDNVKIYGLEPANLKMMFTTTHFGMYSPLVLLSYAVEHALFGFNPHVFHATNLLLHLMNTLLVLWAIKLLSGNDMAAFITALLFGIHPMHVESVAWIAERKDVLSTFFFLGSLIAYLRYGKNRELKSYLYAAVLMFLSLISKPMAVTAPFVFLLCDHLQERKIDKANLISKIPFFALAVLFAAVTASPSVSYHNIIRPLPVDLPILGGTALACQHIVFYIIKLVLPFRLSCCYPPPDQMKDIPQLVFYFAPLIVALLAALSIYSLKFTRKMFFGAAFFLITIFPVSQFMPEGLVIPADRYTYVPYIGLFFIIAETVLWLSKRYDKKVILTVLLAAAVVLSIFSFHRALVWRNSVTLWTDAVRHHDNVVFAHYNLAAAYFDARYDPRLVIAECDKTLEQDPNFYEAYSVRGKAYDHLGQSEAAMKDFDAALKAHPTYKTWYDRGSHFLKVREYDRAISDLTESIAADPDSAGSYVNRGSAYLAKNETDKAFNDFSRAAEVDPSSPLAYYNMGMLLALKREYRAALLCLNKARSLGMKIDERTIRDVEQGAGR